YLRVGQKIAGNRNMRRVPMTRNVRGFGAGPGRDLPACVHEVQLAEISSRIFAQQLVERVVGAVSGGHQVEPARTEQGVGLALCGHRADACPGMRHECAHGQVAGGYGHGKTLADRVMGDKRVRHGLNSAVVHRRPDTLRWLSSAWPYETITGPTGFRSI